MPFQREPSVVKEVIPKGNILNDNDVGVDYLGHSVYAEALAQRIQSVKTPITIGVFASWGSGKSFLVKHVKDFLRRYEQQHQVTSQMGRKRHDRSKCCCQTVLLIFVISLLITCCIWAVSPNLFTEQFISENFNETPSNATSSPNETTTVSPLVFWTKLSRYVALAVLLFLLVCVSVIVCCNRNWWSSDFFGNFGLISFVAFTKLPIKNHPSSIVHDSSEREVEHVIQNEGQEDEKMFENQRYIFVDFNAWEYAGSDTLWAGIVTKLSDAIEAEFGSVTSRLFRMLEVETMNTDVEKDNSNRLFVKLNNSDVQIKEGFHDIMLQYGVVVSLERYEDWVNSKKAHDKWWVVEFAHYTEAANAKQYLELDGVEVTYVDPAVLRNSANGHNGNTNGHNNTDIELGDFRDISNGKGQDQEHLLDNRSHGQVETQVKSGFCRHFRKYPKTTCSFPNLFWWILLTVVFISLPVMTYVIADVMKLDVFRTPRAVPVTVQIFSWLPALGGSAFVLIRFVWAMFHSQRNRVNTALAGAKGNMATELGFMNKVKTEVHFVTKLIDCVRFTHKKNYKVVIIIDDLDRVPLDKVKSVLEAVSILLSDRSSPFVCLIALDSRVAVKCIEEDMGAALLKANVNGHEYLKKIINLPFCLPEIGNDSKQQYIGGLIDQGDITKKRRAKIKTDVVDETRSSVDQAGKVLRNGQVSPNLNGAENHNSDNYKETNLSTVGSGQDETDGHFDTDTLNEKEFLLECKKFLYESELVNSHLLGNPRNIKRIFNVLSLTALIINCNKKQDERSKLLKSFRTNTQRESRANGHSSRECSLDLHQRHTEANLSVYNEAFAQDMVCWVVLTDQWPYRVSYLLQVIEDADQRSNAGRRSEMIENSKSLFDIYEKHVRPEIHAAGDIDRSLLSLDADPDVLYSFLNRLNQCGNRLNKGRATFLKQYTVNLDHSLKQSIAYQRDVVDIGRGVGKKPNIKTQQTPAVDKVIPAEDPVLTPTNSQNPIMQPSPTNTKTEQPPAGLVLQLHQP